jgi:hypothetical protein
MTLWLLALACNGPGDSSAMPDDSVAPDDSSAPQPDDCDGHEGEILCVDGVATTCDAAGDPVSSDDCAADATTGCFEGKGCGTCPPALTVALSDPAAVEIFVPLDRSGSPDPATRWLSARAVDVSVDPIAAADGQGSLVVESSDPLLQVLADDGTPLSLPATLPPSNTSLLLWADAPVEAQLVARFEHPTVACADDEAHLDVVVGVDPGLAGRALPAYPWFETVRAFHDSDPLTAALDPGRFVDRVGLSADLYVVAPRTAAEWTADRSLVDVSGAVESVTVGTSLTDDLWTVWKKPDAGASFGVDYQLVMDFGQDGTLDVGDIVTGVWDDPILISRDPSLGGPYAVTTIEYSGGTWLGQRTYFPTDIDAMGELPLIVISHGNGHQYWWYDYLGEHLASYGAIVMSHQNETGPGIETASTTTLTNTDYIIENQASIDLGQLDGHIDTHRITWIGHSRGGEGVVRAYDRIRDGDYVPTWFSPEDVVLIASIAPTVYFTVEESDPHDVTYALIAGTADGDVTGGPDSTVGQFFRISQAARGEVSTWYVQGADHNDFNCCGAEDSLWWNSDPSILIGRDETQVIARAYFLALWEHYVMGHTAMGEYLSRVHDTFHAPAEDPDDVVASTFQHSDAEPDLVIDDFQSAPERERASGGGVVTWTVDNVEEGLLDDANGRFVWDAEDSMNGMTQATEFDSDFESGVVFDWDEKDAAYEIELPKGTYDLRSYGYLSFRAAQGTRHPNTVALDGPLSFTVVLVDGTGAESAIDVSSFGVLTETYPRPGEGPGEGWANEFNTIRIPLTSFDADGRAIDLVDVRTIRFAFGPSYGSALGRIGLDDVEVTFR